jgi:excisionase family DNA binding protein
MAVHVSKHKRTYNVRLIKATWPYSVQEVAALYGLHKNAVLRWLKDGLQANGDGRPYRIRGSELARFLSARQRGRKRKCGPKEFYCFKCHAPREAYLGMADIVFSSPTRFRVKAICAVCSTTINKVQGIRNLRKIQESFHVQQMTGEHLLERTDPSVNSDLEAPP